MNSSTRTSARKQAETAAFRRHGAGVLLMMLWLVLPTASTGQEVRIDSIPMPVTVMPSGTTDTVTIDRQGEAAIVTERPRTWSDDPKMWFGIIGGYSRITNTTTLAVYANSPVCGTFSDGVSTAPHFGLTYEYPVHPALGLSARFLYMQ
ncbi:MAG: hypothetical protein ACKOAG_08255, partial [Candidatus Kapaibacterium sp.]